MGTKESIHKSWQKFLAPLAGAAITALGVYATAAQQSYSHENDSKVAVIEARVTEIETLRSEFKDLSKEVHELIGEIRAQRRNSLCRSR